MIPLLSLWGHLYGFYKLLYAQRERGEVMGESVGRAELVLVGRLLYQGGDCWQCLCKTLLEKSPPRKKSQVYVDSSVRLRKLACRQQQPLKTILVIEMANHPPQLISHRQPPPSSKHGKTFIQPLHQYLGCYTCLAINNFFSVWTHFSSSILYF